MSNASNRGVSQLADGQAVRPEPSKSDTTADRPMDSLIAVRDALRQFAKDRDWDQYHTPRNLMLALTGEIGELAEIFQWRGEVERGLPGFTDAEREHVGMQLCILLFRYADHPDRPTTGEEMSDCLLYLCRMADACDIDLPHAVELKLQKNAKKYPASRVYGSSKKYDEYHDNS